MSLVTLCTNRRVLFVDAIRNDVPSGGRTATTTVIRMIQGAATVRRLQLAPRGAGLFDRAIFSIASLPGPLFVLLQRRLRLPSLEFLTRLSPLLMIRCYWLCLRFRPDVVVLNHHAAFLYAFTFSGPRVVFVWHDLPSLKRDALRSLRADARRCLTWERLFLRRCDHALTYSGDDVRYLRRMHYVDAEQIPATDVAPTERADVTQSDALLLVGNWRRSENCEGADRFLSAYIRVCGTMPNSFRPIAFTVAGTGAETFVGDWLRRNPGDVCLRIRAIPRYASLSEFSELALLAPLLRGAGIKIKTLEAWAAGFPVLGTSQAFTGIAPSTWRIGGLRLSDIDALARLCASPEALIEACRPLEPFRAYAMYRTLTAGDTVPCVESTLRRR